MPFDTSEVRALARDLGDAATWVGPQAGRVVAKGALNIKNDLVREARGVSYAPHFPRSITYDLSHGRDGWEAEIGPDKDRTQGALGNLLYFGRSDTGPRLPDPVGALEREAPNVERWLADIAGDVL